jgi:hypothetical protein
VGKLAVSGSALLTNGTYPLRDVSGKGREGKGGALAYGPMIYLLADFWNKTPANPALLFIYKYKMIQLLNQI